MISKSTILAWANSQKQKYNNGMLSQRQIEKLEAVSGWTWSERDKDWNDRFNELYQYVNIGGNSLTIKPTFRFHSWVNYQRHTYKTSRLSQEKIKKLESITGWAWDISTKHKNSNDELWLQRYNDVIAYYDKFKKLPSNKDDDKGIKSLSHWCMNQKIRYAIDELPKHRVDKLNSLEWWKW